MQKIIKKYLHSSQNFLLLIAVMFSLTAFANPTATNPNTANHIWVDNNLNDAHLLLQAAASQTKVLHLFSHGKPGQLYINGQWLQKEGITQFIQTTFNLQQATQLNIYGCNFAQGEAGLQAVAYIEQQLGISIAASTNLTGAGGDWTLELGNPQANLALSHYPHNLQCPPDPAYVVISDVFTVGFTRGTCPGEISMNFSGISGGTAPRTIRAINTVTNAVFTVNIGSATSGSILNLPSGNYTTDVIDACGNDNANRVVNLSDWNNPLQIGPLFLSTTTTTNTCGDTFLFGTRNSTLDSASATQGIARFTNNLGQTLDISLTSNGAGTFVPTQYSIPRAFFNGANISYQILPITCAGIQQPSAIITINFPSSPFALSATNIGASTFNCLPAYTNGARNNSLGVNPITAVIEEDLGSGYEPGRDVENNLITNFVGTIPSGGLVPIFPGLAFNRQYRITYTDACGAQVVQLLNNVAPPVFNPVLACVNNGGNGTSFASLHQGGTIQLGNTGGAIGVSFPVNLTIINGPATWTSSNFAGFSGTYNLRNFATNPLNLGSTSTTGQFATFFANGGLPPGTYTVRITDACGTEWLRDVTMGCVNRTNLFFLTDRCLDNENAVVYPSFTTPFISYPPNERFSLYDSNGNFITNQTPAAFNVPTFPNLPPGTYEVRFGGVLSNDTQYTFDALASPLPRIGGGFLYSTPLVIAPLGDLDAIFTYFPSCGGGDGLISSSSFGGTSPYQYRLLDNGVPITPFQSSPNFLNLPFSNNYTVQSTDFCSRTSVRGVNVITAPEITVIQPTCPFPSVGGSIIFEQQASVQYSIDNGVTFQNSNVFENLLPGTYQPAIRSTVVGAATCNVTTAPIEILDLAAIDTDGDGIADACDQDNDNDGISDRMESILCTANNNFVSWLFDDQPFLRPVINDATTLSAASRFVAGPGLEVTTSAQSAQISQIEAINFAGAVANSEYVDLSINTSHTIIGATLRRYSYQVSASGAGNLGYRIALAISSDNFVSQTLLFQDRLVANTAGVFEVDFATPFNLSRNNKYSLRLYFYKNGASGALDPFRFDNFRLQGCQLLPIDTDSDLVFDYLDNDSDNDGIPDALEANNSLLPADFNSSGKLVSAVDALGIPIIASGGFTPVDTDGDGVRNFQDIDSDNDGIVDVIESQPSLGYIAPTGFDADADGIDNAFDAKFNPANTLTFILEDTDGDGTPDMFDADSDDDGLLDVVEAAQGAFVAGDTDGDGLANVFENSNQSSGVNSDNWGQTAFNPFPSTINPGVLPNWRYKLCTQLPNTNAPTNFALIGISTHAAKQPNWPGNVPNGALVLESSNRGFVITRLSTANRDAATFVPVEGMLIYNNTDNRIQLYKNGAWVNLKRGCNN